MFSNNTSVATIIIADFAENVKGLSKKILIEKRNGCKSCTLPTNTTYSLDAMKINILPPELKFSMGSLFSYFHDYFSTHF